MKIKASKTNEKKWVKDHLNNGICGGHRLSHELSADTETACWEALDWLSKSHSLDEAWQQCNRPDWMLWMLSRMKPNKKDLKTCRTFMRIAITKLGKCRSVDRDRYLYIKKSWKDGSMMNEPWINRTLEDRFVIIDESELQDVVEMAGTFYQNYIRDEGRSSLFRSGVGFATGAKRDNAGRRASRFHKEAADELRRLFPSPWRY